MRRDTLSPSAFSISIPYHQATKSKTQLQATCRHVTSRYARLHHHFNHQCQLTTLNQSRSGIKTITSFSHTNDFGCKKHKSFDLETNSSQKQKPLLKVLQSGGARQVHNQRRRIRRRRNERNLLRSNRGIREHDERALRRSRRNEHPFNLPARELQLVLVYFSQNGRDSWCALEVFEWLKKENRVDEETMELMVSIMCGWVKKMIESKGNVAEVADFLVDMDCVGLKPSFSMIEKVICLYWDLGEKEKGVLFVKGQIPVCLGL